MLVVAALTALGAALRVMLAEQSLFADELSTRYMVAGRSLAGVVSVVHTDAEITPPLYFVASWLTTRADLSAELLRAPSLLAGTAAIPLVYVLGTRTVGRPAGLVAAALTTFSPFMAYYSAEARGYALMITLVLGSTLALLAALESGRVRWWAAYALCACAAVYTHYTSVFALAGQLGWVLWAHPQARRAALAASATAGLAFMPWLSGLRGDLDSPTTDILSALQPFDPGYVRASLTHWAVGYPYATPQTRLADLPGVPALVSLGLALVLAIAGSAAAAVRRGGLPRPNRPALLVIVLAASVPVGEALASAIGPNLFGTRNLAASWPAFALCLAWLLVSAGPRLRVVASALAIAAFGAGALKLLDPQFQRPDYDAVVSYIERTARAGDVVLDAASLSPAGVPTAIGLGLDDRPVFELGRDRVAYDPFRILGTAPPVEDVVGRATTAARGGRVYVVVLAGRALGQETLDALRGDHQVVDRRSYPGLDTIEVVLVEPQTAMGA